MKRVVMSIHGIESDGAWQRELEPVLLEDKCIKPRPLNYGRFSTARFLIGRARKHKTEWFLREYTHICEEEGVSRPSIIAHSFGTYILANALEKYPQIRFDKIILCGSIVRPDFDWPALLGSGQVNRVRNEYGRQDFWAGIVGAVVHDAGPSGRVGFTRTHPSLCQVDFRKYEHSNYFHPLHFQQDWMPFLTELTLCDGDAADIRDNFLDVMIQTVARKLAWPVVHLRANVFWPHFGELQMTPELQLRMTKSELALQIPFGLGCAGKAFQTEKPTFAVFVKDWGDYTLPTSDLRKVHPGLRWILSMPIPDPDSHVRVSGVLSIDGLHDPITRSDVSSIRGDVRATAQLIGVALKNVC